VSYAIHSVVTSNVSSMDAISFVLGIKSSYLRSSNVKDLVYRGRVLKTSKINADGDAIDGAEATAYVNDDASSDEKTQTKRGSQRNDPTTAWVMAVYEDDAGEEQTWKRSITSGGQTDYRLNNRLVTAKQYTDALEAENILVKARNFLVFQGDVESIASRSPRELTQLVEQISGSLEFKADYERLKEEMSKADDDHAFKLQQRRAMNTEIRQYQEQKREADAYERKVADRDEAIVNQVLWKLFHFQKVVDESSEKISKHQEDMKEFRRAQEKYEKKLDEARQQQAKATKEVSKFERLIKKKEKEVDERENSLIPKDTMLGQSTQRISEQDGRLKTIAKDRDKYKADVDKYEKDLATIKKAQARWEKEWDQTQRQQGRALTANDLAEYNNLRSEVGRRAATDQIKVDNITRKLKTDEETASNLKMQAEKHESKLKELEEVYNQLKERHASKSAQHKRTKADIDQKKTQYNAMQSDRIKNEQRRREKIEHFEEIARRLDDARGHQQASRKEQAAKELVRELKTLFPGVKGRLHELCRPKQKKYETAMGVVLGRHFDSIVTDTEQTANECISHFKSKRAGWMAFIPLDTIQVKAVNANFKGMHKGMRLAIDTIEYDSAYERAILYACGNSMVCDSMDVAKYLCFDRKVNATAVTLDGTKIHKGGLMTGGQGRQDKQARWDDAATENLTRTFEKLETEIRALDPTNDRRRVQEEETLQSELRGLELQYNELVDEVKSLDRNLKDKKKEMDFEKFQLREVQPKYKEQAQTVDNLREELQGYQKSISDVEDEVFASFCQRLGYKDIRVYEKQQGSLQQESLIEKQKFATQLNDVQNRLVFEKTRLQKAEDRMKMLQESVHRDKRTLKGLEAERAAILNELDTLKAELDLLSEQLSELQSKADEEAQKVGEHRREVEKRNKNVAEKLRELAELEADVSKNRAEQYSLLRQCRIEEIKIPLTEDSKPLSELPLVAGDTGPDDMDVDGDMTLTVDAADDHGIEVDYDQLDDDLKEDDSEKTEEALKDKIKSIEHELEKMAPNMHVAERLESTENRLKDADKERLSAQRRSQQAREDFEHVRSQRKELFDKAFNHIKDHISRVYKDLTKSVQTPLGGQAYLDVENEDEPYLEGVKYHAMPPLKRFRDMEHLSGGEKTMAALALLFAVHSYQPSPFFVLDEVDAALDNANVAKLLAYIQRNKGPGMQFIVISLKAGLFEGSETLVGVMRDQGINSSKTLTLDVSLQLDSKANTFADNVNSYASINLDYNGGQNGRC
jgi:structural maintenance of chromosome 1